MPDDFEVVEHFTAADRRELIKQSLLLDQLSQDLKRKPDRAELSTERVVDHEARLRALESLALRLDGAIRLALWGAPLMSTGVAAAVSILIKLFWH